MSINRTKNTIHSYERSKERAGLTKRKAKEFIKEAYLAGIAAKALPEGPVKDFLVSREKRTRKRIKVYKNWVFVFCTTSTKCVTMYSLNEELLSKQAEYDNKKQ